MKKIIYGFILLISAISLAACGSDSANETVAAPEDQDKVIQYFNSPGQVTIVEIADNLGYFETLELENVGVSKGGPSDIQLVQSEDVDFGTVFNGAVIKALAQGVKVQAVISAYGSNELYNQKFYVKEDSDIKTAKDLIGKKVGINTLGAHGDFLVSEYLRQGGLTEDEIKDVELVTVPWANGEQVLRAGQVDAIYFDTELAIVAENNGGVRELFNDVSLFGNYNGASYVFSEKYIKNNPDTVHEFVTGVAKAYKWTQEHSTEEVIAKKKEIIAARGQGETTTIIEAYTDTGVASVGGSFNETDWTIWTEWLEKNSDINLKNVNLDTIYTNEFNDLVQ